MEGRIPPPLGSGSSSSGDRPDDRRLTQLQYSSAHSLALANKKPSTKHKQSPNWYSFVVQLPKDQIYHVPSPERGEYVQKYREEQSNAKPYVTRTCQIALASIIFIVVLIVVLVNLAPLLNPKGPSFSVSRVAAKHSKRGSSYRVTVKAKNPNEKMSMSYDGLGLASLSYKGEAIGKGKVRDLVQGEGRSSNVQLVLEGSDLDLPKKIEKSFKDSKPKDLVLKMRYSVSLKLWFIKTKASETDVTCKLRVNKLKGVTKILRQSCQT